MRTQRELEDDAITVSKTQNSSYTTSGQLVAEQVSNDRMITETNVKIQYRKVMYRST